MFLQFIVHWDVYLNSDLPLHRNNVPPQHIKKLQHDKSLDIFDFYLLAPCRQTKKVEELHNTVKKKCFISSRIVRIKYTNPCSVWHDFTKLAISRLIMVRFEKFEIWHAQCFDADLWDVTMTTRATRRTRWRHARAWRRMTSSGHPVAMLTSLTSFLALIF